jgi:hypothetical protein
MCVPKLFLKAAPSRSGVISDALVFTNNIKVAIVPPGDIPLSGLKNEKSWNSE